MTSADIEALQESLLRGRQMFDIEITTICNKQCPICPRHNFMRDGLSMTSETFALLLEWLPKDCDIMFAGFGEPLINPNLPQYIRLLTESGRSCTVLTNGKKLSDMIIDELFDSGLNKLQISILQDEGMDQLRKFVPIIKPEYRSRVCFNVIVSDTDFVLDNADEILNMGFIVDYKKVHNRGGSLCAGIPSTDLKTCGTFFSVSFISADGGIFCCSNDINGRFRIGNVRDLTFGKLIEYKRNFLGDKSVCKLCDQCTDEFRVRNFERSK